MEKLNSTKKISKNEFLITKLKKALTENPVALEESYVDIEGLVQYETPLGYGNPFYWLIRFESGIRIPYPMLILEFNHTHDSEPFPDEMKLMQEQEKVIHEAYSFRPELREMVQNLVETWRVELSISD